jgi:hypothetical protein
VDTHNWHYCRSDRRHKIYRTLRNDVN